MEVIIIVQCVVFLFISPAGRACIARIQRNFLVFPAQCAVPCQHKEPQFCVSPGVGWGQAHAWLAASLAGVWGAELASHCCSQVCPSNTVVETQNWKENIRFVIAVASELTHLMKKEQCYVLFWQEHYVWPMIGEILKCLHRCWVIMMWSFEEEILRDIPTLSMWQRKERESWIFMVEEAAPGVNKVHTIIIFIYTISLRSSRDKWST